MRVIQGKSPEDRFSSIDGILHGLLSKQKMIQEKVNKKNRSPHSFNISGYKDTCESGDVVATFFSLAVIDIKKAVIVIDEYPKDTELFAIVNIITDKDIENGVKIPIKKGANSVEDTRQLNPGDRLSVSIIYPEKSPKGIWVAMRGEQA